MKYPALSYWETHSKHRVVIKVFNKVSETLKIGGQGNILKVTSNDPSMKTLGNMITEKLTQMQMVNIG